MLGTVKEIAIEKDDPINIVRDDFVVAFSSQPRKAVAACIRPIEGKAKSEDGYKIAHSYAVIDFDPKGDGGGTVYLRDPQGFEEKLSLSLETFVRNFNRCSIAEKGISR